MKTAMFIAIACLMGGCGTTTEAPSATAKRFSAVLKQDFRLSDVQNVTLVLQFPDPDKISQEEGQAFGNAIRRQSERRWTLREPARVGLRQRFVFDRVPPDLIKRFDLPESTTWVLVAQLDARHTFAVAPKADFGETGGTVLVDGTRIPNPTICLVVEVVLALLDTRRGEVVWMDKEEIGPVIDGYPMKSADMTPALVAKMTEKTFKSLPTPKK